MSPCSFPLTATISPRNKHKKLAKEDYDRWEEGVLVRTLEDQRENTVAESDELWKLGHASLLPTLWPESPAPPGKGPRPRLAHLPLSYPGHCRPSHQSWSLAKLSSPLRPQARTSDPAICKWNLRCAAATDRVCSVAATLLPAMWTPQQNQWAIAKDNQITKELEKHTQRLLAQD